MRVLISGATGLIGSALADRLADRSDDVVRLSRSLPEGRGVVRWDPAAGRVAAEALEGIDAVVHLAGENIAAGRWNERRKSAIRDSRVVPTRLLAERVAGLARPPKVFVAASAIGFYGNRGDEPLTEASPAGEGFLAETSVAWEESAGAVAEAGIRLAYARIGIVLSPNGGALASMLPPFRFGLGGRLGPGTQYMSWIALEDAVSALCHLIDTGDVSGPANLTAPNPVTNAEFTRVLARVLGRPAVFPAPSFGLRLVLGEMADALLLASTRVVPERLLAGGFRFAHADLERALRSML